jgi:hypothetical protein
MGKGTCKFHGCQDPVRGKGYCARHYRQWRRGILPKPRYKSCHAEGCHKPLIRRGLCVEHFAQKYNRSAGSERTE